MHAVKEYMRKDICSWTWSRMWACHEWSHDWTCTTSCEEI